jgi:hypothetical protein
MYVVRVSCTAEVGVRKYAAIPGMEARYMSVAIGLTALRIPSATTSRSRSFAPRRFRRDRNGSLSWGESMEFSLSRAVRTVVSKP